MADVSGVLHGPMTAGMQICLRQFQVVVLWREKIILTKMTKNVLSLWRNDEVSTKNILLSIRLLKAIQFILYTNYRVSLSGRNFLIDFCFDIIKLMSYRYLFIQLMQWNIS